PSAATLSLLTPPSAAARPATPLSGAGPAGTRLLGAQHSLPGLLATGPDAGGPPLVKGVDAVTVGERYPFLAYTRRFHGGVRVAVGDSNGDGTPDVITGPGAGGGSQVRVFNGSNGNPLAGTLGSFNAFAAGQTDGVFVAAADVNGDGKADV